MPKQRTKSRGGSKDLGVPQVIGFRQSYSVNIIAVKEGESIDVNPNPDARLSRYQYLVVIGDNKNLRRLESRH